MNRPRSYQVTSSDGVHVYRVDRAMDGAFLCTCAGFHYRRDCRHIREVAEREKEAEMSEDKALVPIKVEPPPVVLPSPAELRAIDYVAANLVAQGVVTLPQIRTAQGYRPMTREEVRAVLLAGWEFGVRPMTAIRHFFIVGGRVEPDAQILAGIVNSRDPTVRFWPIVSTNERCCMRLERPSRGVAGEIEVTIEDARRAGLLKDGSGWNRFPADMLRWTALKRLVRIYCPDLINGIAAAAFDDSGGEAEAAFDDSVVTENGDEAEAPHTLPPPALALYNEGGEPEADLSDEPQPAPEPEPEAAPESEPESEPEPEPESEPEPVPEPLRGRAATRDQIEEILTRLRRLRAGILPADYRALYVRIVREYPEVVVDGRLRSFDKLTFSRARSLLQLLTGTRN